MRNHKSKVTRERPRIVHTLDYTDGYKKPKPVTRVAGTKKSSKKKS